MLIPLIIWGIFGILGYGQTILNLAVSVQFQKEVSKQIENYNGYNWFEVLLLTTLLLGLLIVSIVGGIPWFIFVQKVFKKEANRRLKIERINRKMFDHGWCW